MTDTEEILRFFKDINLPVVGDIVSNPSTDKGFFVPLRLTRSADGRKSPSGRVLASAKSGLLALGYKIDFILSDEDALQIEESLRASLLSSFPEDVRNSFFSPDTQPPQVWVDFKRQPDAQTMGRLEGHIRKFSELFALPPLDLIRLGESDAATKIEFLSAIRQLAPVTMPVLARELEAQGRRVPSQDWANRRLDVLRKSGLVLRRHDGAYVLTEKSLMELGTSTGRRSPDVRLFLALARRSS